MYLEDAVQYSAGAELNNTLVVCLFDIKRISRTMDAGAQLNNTLVAC